MYRRTLQEIAISLAFIALATYMTWPLANHLSTAISDPGDPFFTTWALDWSYHALTTGATLFDANIFYPAKNSLALSEHMIGVAMFLYPLLASGVEPLTAHNIAVLLGFAGCSYTMYTLSRWVTHSTPAALVAGLAYGFVGYRFHHLPHLHFIWSLWLPIILLALLALAEKPTWLRAAGLTAATILNALSSPHWMVFAALAVPLTAVAHAAIERRFSKRFWTALAISQLLALAILLPFLLPYRTARATEKTDRSIEDVFENGAQWSDLAQPHYGSALYGTFASDDAIGHERTLLAGVAVYLAAAYGLSRVLMRTRGTPSAPVASINALVLALGGLMVLVIMTGGTTVAVGRLESPILHPAIVATALFSALALRCFSAPLERRPGGELSSRIRLAATAAAVWIALGIFGARGLRGWLHSALFELVPVYRGIRMPGRWIMIAFVGFALAASVCLALVRSRRHRALLSVLMAAVTLAETRVVPIRWYYVSNEPRPVYDWLAGVNIRGGIMELPLTQEFAYEYMWRSTRHHRPLLNGVSSYTPAHYAELIAAYEQTPIPDAFLSLLEQRKCSLLIVHEGLLRARAAPLREWLRRSVDSGRVTFVRRFDAGGSADYIFALTTVEPGAAALRGPEARDASGRTPSENARAFLEGEEWTFVRGPIMRYDKLPQGVVRGPIIVQGWAVAEKPITEIAALVGNPRIRVRAARFERADVGAVLPWHPDCSLCGFRIEVPEGLVIGTTSLQIAITLSDGTVVQKPTVFFEAALRSNARWRAEELRGLLQRLNASDATFRAVFDGEQGIEESTEVLLSSPADETDRVFARRVTLAIWGGENPDAENRLRADLARGVARRRSIAHVLSSRDFAARFLEGGPLTPKASWR